MPLSVLAIHVALCAAVFVVALRVKPESLAARVLAIAFLSVVIVGAVIERRSEAAWASLGVAGPNLVFFSNLLVEGATVLAVILWRCAPDKPARRRAKFLAVPLVGLSLWTYAWYFRPIPNGLHGELDSRGFCGQTSQDSCSAAAAVMLLAQHGIKMTEREMAEFCMTRAGLGTSPLGLVRGLYIVGSRHRLHPYVESGVSAAQLHSVSPAIISVGIRPNTPPEIAAKMEGYGWSESIRHTVVVLSADPLGKWVEVADPSYGPERWPVQDLMPIWNRAALTLKSN